MLLAMDLGSRSIVQGKIERNLDHQPQNKSENRGNRTFVLRPTSQTSLFLTAVSAICSSNAMKCF